MWSVCSPIAPSACVLLGATESYALEVPCEESIACIYCATDFCYTTLGSLTALVTLNLGHNELSGSIPAELGVLTALDTLDLGHNGLSGSIPTELGFLTALDFLHFKTNQLRGVVPLQVVQRGGALNPHCNFEFNPGLGMPGSPGYVDADVDKDGFICFIRLGTTAR